LKKEYDVEVLTEVYANKRYAAVILAVVYDDFKSFDFKILYGRQRDI